MIAGWSAGVRAAFTWLVLIIVTVPVLAVILFVSMLVFGGAIGSPF